jgi:hypothetical protein
MEILAIQILLTFALLLGHLIIVVGERLTRSKPALSSVVMRDLKFPKRVEPAIQGVSVGPVCPLSGTQSGERK